jgi:Transposase and inactivated derivatives, IS30 family
MNTALVSSIMALPVQLRKTLTWDRGKELSGHAQLALDTGTKVFFAEQLQSLQQAGVASTG